MKVLYATDGSPSAVAAGRVLTKLFRRDGVEVDVVSVTHSGSFRPGDVLLELDPIGERRADSQEIVAHSAGEFREAGFHASTKVVEGPPGHELVKLAKTGYDVIALGAGSHSWLGNRLLGSVSTYVLHEAPCSVVIVHDAPDAENTGHVLIGVDGSDTSEETVRMVARSLDPGRCEIEVLSVVAYQVPMVAPVLVGPVVADAKLIERADAELVKRAGNHVDVAARFLRDAGFKTTTRVEHGGAVTVLLEEANETKADLIAVGSRGFGPIRRALLGSVSDQVARHASAALVGRFGGRP